MGAPTPSLRLERDGAEHLPGAATVIRDRLEAALARLPGNRPGLRLLEIPNLKDLLGAESAIGRIAASRLGDGVRPVRAILFDKSGSANWALGWHQDRTIAVAGRRDVAGFGPWRSSRACPMWRRPFPCSPEC